MKSQRMTRQRILTAMSPLSAMAVTFAWLSLASGLVTAAPVKEGGPEKDTESGYTDTYLYKECEFVDEGENPYYILWPGYQLILEGPEDGEHITLAITVTDQTKKILIPEIGWVSTRVIEEKEWANGIPKETSTTFFAIDKKTGNVYDFGDETDIFGDDGKTVVGHEGGWRAGQPDENGLAWPGIFMPGTFLLGAKYYQQLAEGNSMERAENVEMGLTVKTPAGTFKNCIRVRETNWSEPQGAETPKTHAPGIGLIGEETLELVAYGYDVFDRDKGVLKGRIMPDIEPIAGHPSATRQTTVSQLPNRKISDEKAVEIALKKVPGEVTHVGLERKLGKLSIVVEVQADTGVETDVIIDMETGEVRGFET